MNPKFLKDIINLEQWQKIQDLFADVIGVTIHTVDTFGDLLTKPSRLANLCARFRADTCCISGTCKECLKTKINHFLERQQDKVLCPIGLPSFIIPVVVEENEIVGFLVVGPVILGHRGKPKDYQDIAQSLGIDIDSYMDGLREIKVLSFQTLNSVLCLLRDAITYMVKLGYQQHKLENWLPGFLQFSDINKKAHAQLYLNKLLNTLLDIALEITQGESGSVMLSDEEHNQLFVKVSRGLREERVVNVRCDAHTGIPGIVREERKGYLITSELSDVAIKRYLNRPEITASMVIPIAIENCFYGLFTANSYKKTNKFTKRNFELLSHLGELAAAAISTFHIDKISQDAPAVP